MDNTFLQTTQRLHSLILIVNENIKFARYQNSFLWLKDAGYANVYKESKITTYKL